MTAATERPTGARIAWMLIVSPLVSAALGAVGGGITVTAQAFVDHPEMATRGFLSDMFLYGAVAGLVLGSAGGLVGGLASCVAGIVWLRHAKRVRWMMVSMAAAAGIGLASSILFLWTTSGTAGAFVFAIGCTAACMAVGAAIGVLGWREFRSHA